MNKLSQDVIELNARWAKMMLDIDLEYADIMLRMGVKNFRMYRPWL